MTGRPLLVMIPGAYFQPGDFAAHGFIAALRHQPGGVDAIEANLPAARYLEGDAAAWLEAEIIAPSRARGHRRLWLLGISLGAMGALLHARAYSEALEGMILLAPFIGTRGLVAEVVAAGGLAQWEPGTIAPQDSERGLLAGLKDKMPPRLHLGYGRADRYATSAQLLAATTPEERVFVVDGDHDWPTWERLWHQILATAPFDAAPRRTAFAAL